MLKRYLTTLLFIVCDILLVDCALGITFLTTDYNPFLQFRYGYINFVILPLFFVLFCYLLKVYNIMWRYSHYHELIRIAACSFLALLMTLISQVAIFNKRFSLQQCLILIFLSFLFVFVQRLIFKNIIVKIAESQKAESLSGNESEFSGNIMLIGAGNAGQALINEFSHKWRYRNAKIRCVVDDDEYKQGLYISNIKVIGGRNIIEEAVKKYDISTIIFAIPTCSNKDKAEILNICQKTECKVRVLPDICKLYDVSELAGTIRKVRIEDLLGREPIDINLGDKLAYVTGKVVLVTGGGGTIGSELCRQIAVHNPRQLIIFDIYENNAYEIQNELRRKYPNLDLVTLIGSVRDTKRLDYLFRTYSPQIVYHAAAHKHVPLMEDSPNETIKNNVFGTYKTANAASKYGVEKFVLISTDKAVNPTNIMGASKRICEMIVQTCDKHSKTEFVAVRFGNVLGSNGSVIPLFEKQILAGGPVTVTDPNIIRYFMTIPEAVSLVLQAGANAKGGEIFVLDMGEPVKILSLAENLIRLSGFTPYKDIKIEFTGLRPGEKLYEELLMSEEGLTATENDLIHIGKPIEFDEDFFIETLEKLRQAMYDENADIRGFVKEIVTTYKPENK